MQIPLFQVDCFTANRFAGNPAAVCPLDHWLPETTMQAIAAENNLSETAFLVRRDDLYELRWFTPKAEVDLCGHATLAAAFVIFHLLETGEDTVRFHSPKSGSLSVSRQDDLLRLDFPSRPPEACPCPPDLAAGLGLEPAAVLQSTDYLAVFADEQQVIDLAPDMKRLSRLDRRGVIVTAPGKRADFVSRFFAPRLGVDEDPVTGSAHCTLIPYWSARLDRTSLHALQVSERGGELFCRDLGDRVAIAGRAVLYLQGVISL